MFYKMSAFDIIISKACQFLHNIFCACVCLLICLSVSERIEPLSIGLVQGLNTKYLANFVDCSFACMSAKLSQTGEHK